MDVQLILRTIALICSVAALILIVIDCCRWHTYTKKLLKQLNHATRLAERQKKHIQNLQEMVDRLKSEQERYSDVSDTDI